MWKTLFFGIMPAAMRHKLLGVQIDDFSDAELSLKLEHWLAGTGSHVITTPNAEFLLEAQRHPTFKNLLNQSDLAVADSVSLQYAVAALSDQRLRYRIAGVDLLDRLCDTTMRHQARVVLLGGDPGSAQTSVQKLRQRFVGLDAVELDPGRISWEGNRLAIANELIQQIRTLKPLIVAVALGQHKQEQFIDQVRSQCPSVKIWIGVGGALEMISGQKRRAPNWMSRVGFEWLWRLWIEPSRARRIANAVIIFPLIIAREAIRRGTLLRSIKQVFSEIYRHWSI